MFRAHILLCIVWWSAQIVNVVYNNIKHVVWHCISFMIFYWRINSLYDPSQKTKKSYYSSKLWYLIGGYLLRNDHSLIISNYSLEQTCLLWIPSFLFPHTNTGHLPAMSHKGDDACTELTPLKEACHSSSKVVLLVGEEVPCLPFCWFASSKWVTREQATFGIAWQCFNFSVLHFFSVNCCLNRTQIHLRNGKANAPRSCFLWLCLHSFLQSHQQCTCHLLMKW